MPRLRQEPAVACLGTTAAQALLARQFPGDEAA
jgi:hypothetical protein